MNATIPQLAVSVALRHRDDGRFLLVKRGHAPAKGQWAFAGGRVEAGETMEEAARRELKEETGLDVQALTLVDQIELVQSKDLPGSPAHHFLLNIHTGYGSGEPQAADDAADARWMTLDEMADYLVTKSTLAFAKRIAQM